MERLQGVDWGWRRKVGKGLGAQTEGRGAQTEGDGMPWEYPQEQKRRRKSFVISLRLFFFLLFRVCTIDYLLSENSPF